MLNTDSGESTPLPPEHDAHNTQAMPLQRYLRWAAIPVIAALAVGMAWIIGHEGAKSVTRRRSEIPSETQPPLLGSPKPSRIAVIHNAEVPPGYVRAVDGTALPYTGEADSLVSNGTILTNLSLKEFARRLNLRPESIANPQSPGVVDSNAELFRAQVITLTEIAKKRSREMRKRQLEQGRPPDAVFAEWDVRVFSFTLRKLQNPTAEEAEILSAIIAAHETAPQPGNKIRAVGVARGELAPGRIAAAAGYLPTQTQHEAAKELLARP